MLGFIFLVLGCVTLYYHYEGRERKRFHSMTGYNFIYSGPGSLNLL
jgi:hypothetical protein